MYQHFAEALPSLVIAAGLGQIALIVGSLAIPRVLNWHAETAKLRPLTRQVFWTYAGYIWAKNLCFGLLSALAPQWLLDHSPLATAVGAFIAAYWVARLIIQFAFFHWTDSPQGLRFRFAEAALVSLFLFLTLVYGLTVVFNLAGAGS